MLHGSTTLGRVQTVRIALAQVNPVVGDIAGNVALCRQAVATARARHAQIVLLPEMVITGYPVEDLALRPAFQEASESAVAQLAREIAADGNGEAVVIVGYLKGTDRSRKNCSSGRTPWKRSIPIFGQR